MDFREFKRRYLGLSFEEKKKIKEEWLKKYPQPLGNWKIKYCNEYLSYISQRENKDRLKILEVGPYNGLLALKILEKHPSFTWIGYDIVEYPLRPELTKYNFRRIVLDREIYDVVLDRDYDVLYTGDTLEHFSNQEIDRIIERTSFIPYHIHIVDFSSSKNGDAHVMKYTNNTLRDLFTRYYDILVEKGEKGRRIYLLKKHG